jgi:hypothetical protein
MTLTLLIVVLLHRVPFCRRLTHHWMRSFLNPSDSISSYSDVCTKYQEASKIVNLTLEGLVSQCIPGAKILDLCEFGSKVMEAAAAKLYTKKVNGKTIDRGVAFPVCISVNDTVCNFSPLGNEEVVSTKTECRLEVEESCPGPLYKWVTSLPVALCFVMEDGVPRLIRRPFNDRKRKEKKREIPWVFCFMHGPGSSRITSLGGRSW